VIVSCVSELTYWPRKTFVSGESRGGKEDWEIGFDASLGAIAELDGCGWSSR
jgi:hypothetical protein